MENNLMVSNDEVLCRERIVSEDYADFITEYDIDEYPVLERFSGECYLKLDESHNCVYSPIDRIKPLSVMNYPYKSIPTLYGLMDTVALEETGILRLQNQPVLNLKGKGIIVGIIDTGIDYTHKAFMDEIGNTRILNIWDQTDNSGNLPKGFGYGSEYSESDINKALGSSRPLDIVPVTDEIGHGTFLAGVVGGSLDEENDFVGAVPECSFVIVKLKPAKQYLRDYFLIEDNVPAYQENDIMIALRYMTEKAREYNMPISVVLGVGSNRGSHKGRSPLSIGIENFTRKSRNAIAVAAGNEGNKRHHYRGSVSGSMRVGVSGNRSAGGYVGISVGSDVRENVNFGYENVEVYVGANEQGFIVELWANNPGILSVGLESPSGEVLPKITARIGEKETIYTIFDSTVIDIEYAVVEQLSGDELIIMRFMTPSEGVWKIRVYNEIDTEGIFDVWLPISGFVSDNVYFLKPEPDYTITTPADTDSAIVLSSYSSSNGAFDANSSRGFLRNNEIKPDIAAPGVRVQGPARDNRYTYKSGTSVAAAITAGAAAQILNWGLINGNYEILGNEIIKSYFIRGAKREAGVVYPSTEWGYGKLDVVNALNLLR